jgi:hypothetical protein
VLAALSLVAPSLTHLQFVRSDYQCWHGVPSQQSPRQDQPAVAHQPNQRSEEQQITQRYNKYKPDIFWSGAGNPTNVGSIRTSIEETYHGDTKQQTSDFSKRESDDGEENSFGRRRALLGTNARLVTYSSRYHASTECEVFEHYVISTHLRILKEGSLDCFSTKTNKTMDSPLLMAIPVIFLIK